jgi:hypothetical protein
MHNAHKYIPLSSAIAAGTVVRVDGSHLCTWQPYMMLRTAPFPIYRGLTR